MKKKIILWLLVIIWMIVIFMFSAMDSQKSADLSRKTVENTIENVLTITNGIEITNNHPSEEEIFDIAESLQVLVRKSAHIFLYFVLTMLIINALEVNDIRKRFIIAITICFIYAWTDEFHQLFIPGRSGEFKDCLIDTIGGLIACLTYFIINKFFKKYRENK